MEGSLSGTIDLENWYHIPSVCSLPFAVYKDVDDFYDKWNMLHDFLSVPIKRVLGFLDEFKATATFFGGADTLEHDPDMIESIRGPNTLVSGEQSGSLIKLGFKYDSSVFVNSFYNKTDLKLNTVSSFPYCPKVRCLESGAARIFIDFPWAYYKFWIKIPISEDPIMRFFGATLILKGLQRSMKRGHFIFHFRRKNSLSTPMEAGRGSSQIFIS